MHLEDFISQWAGLTATTDTLTRFINSDFFKLGHK
jgi:hypothetical protein